MDSDTETLAASLPPEPSQTLAQTAYEAVLNRILDGTLAAGGAISEGRLASDLGLSRTPLREAIGRLEGEGLMMRAGRSVTVRVLSLRDYLEVLHMRRMLEGEAAGMAALAMPAETIAALRAQTVAMDGTVSSAEHWALDNDIHDSIARATGSSLLARTVADLRRQTRMFGRDRIPGRFEAGRDEHLRILDALAAHDREAAVAAMHEHLDNAKNAIIAELQRFG